MVSSSTKIPQALYLEDELKNNQLNRLVGETLDLLSSPSRGRRLQAEAHLCHDGQGILVGID